LKLEEQTNKRKRRRLFDKWLKGISLVKEEHNEETASVELNRNEINLDTVILNEPEYLNKALPLKRNIKRSYCWICHRKTISMLIVEVVIWEH
jgi:hypothetical protein